MMMNKAPGTPIQNVATVRPQILVPNVATVRPFCRSNQSEYVTVGSVQGLAEIPTVMTPQIQLQPSTSLVPRMPVDQPMANSLEGLQLHVIFDEQGKLQSQAMLKAVPALTQSQPQAGVTSLLHTQSSPLQIHCVQTGGIQGQVQSGIMPGVLQIHTAQASTVQGQVQPGTLQIQGVQPGAVQSDAIQIQGIQTGAVQGQLIQGVQTGAVHGQIQSGAVQIQGVQTGAVQGQKQSGTIQIQSVQTGAVQGQVIQGVQTNAVHGHVESDVLGIQSVQTGALQVQGQSTIQKSRNLRSIKPAILAPQGKRPTTPKSSMNSVTTPSQGPITLTASSTQPKPAEPPVFFVPTTKLKNSKELGPVIGMLKSSTPTLGPDQSTLSVQKMDASGNMEHVGHLVKSAMNSWKGPVPYFAVTNGANNERVDQITKTPLKIIKEPTQSNKTPNSTSTESRFDLYQCVTLKFHNKNETYLIPVQGNQRTIRLLINGKNQIISLDKDKFVRLSVSNSDAKQPRGIIFLGTDFIKSKGDLTKCTSAKQLAPSMSKILTIVPEKGEVNQITNKVLDKKNDEFHRKNETNIQTEQPQKMKETIAQVNKPQSKKETKTQVNVPQMSMTNYVLSEKPPTVTGKWNEIIHYKNGKCEKTLVFTPYTSDLEKESNPTKPPQSDHSGDGNDFGLKITNVCSLNTDTEDDVLEAPDTSRDIPTIDIKHEESEIMPEISVDAIESVVNLNNINNDNIIGEIGLAPEEDASSIDVGQKTGDSDTHLHIESRSESGLEPDMNDSPAMEEAEMSDSSEELVTTSLNGPEFARDILKHIGSGDIMLDYADQGPMNAQLVESPMCGSVGSKPKPSKTTKRKLSPTSKTAKTKKKKGTGGVPELDDDPTYVPDQDISSDSTDSTMSASINSTDSIGPVIKDEPADILDFGNSSYHPTNRYSTRGVIQQHQQQEEVYTGTEIKDIQIKLERIDHVIGKKDTIYLPNYPQFKKMKTKHGGKRSYVKRKSVEKSKSKTDKSSKKTKAKKAVNASSSNYVNVISPNDVQASLNKAPSILERGCILYKLPNGQAVMLPLCEMNNFQKSMQVNARLLNEVAVNQICATIPEVGSSYTNHIVQGSKDRFNDGTVLLKPSFMVVPPSRQGGNNQHAFTAPTLRFRLPTSLQKQNTTQPLHGILRSCLENQISPAPNPRPKTMLKPANKPPPRVLVATHLLSNAKKVTSVDTKAKPSSASEIVFPNVSLQATKQGNVTILNKPIIMSGAKVSQPKSLLKSQPSSQSQMSQSQRALVVQSQPSSQSQTSQSQRTLVVQSQPIETSRTQSLTSQSSDDNNDSLINLDTALLASQAIQADPNRENNTRTAETSKNDDTKNEEQTASSSSTEETSIDREERLITSSIVTPEMGFRQKDTVQCERVQRLKEMLKEKEEALKKMRQLRLERESSAKQETDSDD